jgi:hypothetical protein
MELKVDNIKDLTELGFTYPLRANLMFNQFKIYDGVNKLVYQGNPSRSLAIKDKERKFITYLVKILNASKVPVIDEEYAKEGIVVEKEEPKESKVVWKFKNKGKK